MLDPMQGTNTPISKSYQDLINYRPADLPALTPYVVLCYCPAQFSAALFLITHENTGIF